MESGVHIASGPSQVTVPLSQAPGLELEQTLPPVAHDVVLRAMSMKSTKPSPCSTDRSCLFFVPRPDDSGEHADWATRRSPIEPRRRRRSTQLDCRPSPRPPIG